MTLHDARAALRARQGKGARYDAPGAPAETLGYARLGTSYFARLLNNLANDELSACSLLPGWSRRRVIARVGYHARTLTRLTAAAASKEPGPVDLSDSARLEEIEDGSTLPARALRGLFRHSAVHLDVEWRDLDSKAWDAVLYLSNGSHITAQDTPWIRAREVWLGAVDLNAGGSFRDMPDELLDRLIGEALFAWTGPPLSVLFTDRAAAAAAKGETRNSVSGTAADVARWLLGRGAHRLTHSTPLPEIPVPGALQL